jgi:hypothetical protein
MSGYGVSRWEMSGDNHSIIEIPALANIKVKSTDVYGKEWEAIERREGASDYGRKFTVKLSLADGYSPSAIQEFSHHGWMRMQPKFYAKWKKLWGDKVYYYRMGLRCDHQDFYYNLSIVPYVGLHFE